MLLGSTTNKVTSNDTEALTIQLIAQQRYSEAYELLKIKKVCSMPELYNLALCLHWIGNFKEVLSVLENIQLPPQLNRNSEVIASSNYQQIRSKQNQTDDHLHGLSYEYVRSFPDLFHDSIVRLKTDCLLQIGDYTKLITIAQPIAHKGYKNITEALELAISANDKRI